MLTTASPLYDPTHYNMGAVWPFVTGFLALGHYQYERPWAGYPLVDALAHLAFDWARGRHPELLSGAYYRPLDTAVPHQFFATSMLASSIAYGLLGWEPDAPAGRARLAPQLPPQWERARVSGLRVGQARLDVAIEQGPGRLSLRLEPRDGPFSLEVRPAWPAGARDAALFVDGTPGRGERGRRSGRGARRARRGSSRPGGPAAGRRGAARAARSGAARPGRAGARLRGDARGLEAASLEGPAGGSAAVRLHGEAPASADGRDAAERGRGDRGHGVLPGVERRVHSRRPRFACTATAASLADSP